MVEITRFELVTYALRARRFAPTPSVFEKTRVRERSDA